MSADKKKIRPLADRLVVERVDAQEATASGIILPGSAAEQPNHGIVLAAGPGRRTDRGEYIPMDVKEGDIVLFAKYGGQSVKLGDKEYLVIKQDDVLGIVQE